MPRLRPLRLAFRTDLALSRGLVFLAYPGGMEQRDLVSGQLGSVNSAASWADVRTHGPAAKTTSSSTGAITFPHSSALGSLTNQITAVVLTAIDSMVDYGVLIGKPHFAASWSSPFYSWGLHRDAGSSSAAWQVGDSANQIISATGFISADSTMRLYGVTFDRPGDVVAFYRDGALHSSHTETQDRDVAHGENAPLTLGNRNSGALGEGIQGAWSMAAVWGRPLTAAEMRALYEDPFILARPRPVAPGSVPSTGGALPRRPHIIVPPPPLPYMEV